MVVSALLLILSFAANRIDPKTITVLAYFAFAFPYLLILNVVIAIIALFSLRWYVIFPLIAIFLNYHNIQTMIAFNDASAHQDTTSIRVMSYNVNLFNHFGKRTANAVTTEELLAYIHEKEPDVICFQEFSDHRQMQPITKFLSNTVGLRYFSQCRSNQSILFGNVIASRYPIIHDSLILFTKSKNHIVFADIVIRKDTFRFFNFHLESFRLEQEHDQFYDQILHSPTVKADQLERNTRNFLRTINQALVKRTKQSKLLAELIAQSPYPTVVCGDLNDPATSYTYRIISQALTDSFVARGTGFGTTYNGRYPAFRIDYILFSKFLVCDEFQTLRIPYSDHYPVLSVLHPVH
ncbi:endonuclease [Bacteroidia bacterium]|nr:endonuclease [Bacteroidia bacterium]